MDNRIKNLKILGIFNFEQLQNNSLNYWWQKKYKEVQNNQEWLIEINNAKDELEILEKEYLINILKKKRGDLIDIKVDDSDTRINLKSETIFNIDGKYVGELENNMKHGQGTFFYTNGDKYIGQWKDNQRYGQGTFFYANSDKYVGKWKDDLKNGKGIKYFSNGNKYIGKWKDDLHKHGQGTYIYSNGDKYSW